MCDSRNIHTSRIEGLFIWTLLPPWNFQFSFMLCLISFGCWHPAPLRISNGVGMHIFWNCAFSIDQLCWRIYGRTTFENPTKFGRCGTLRKLCLGGPTYSSCTVTLRWQIEVFINEKTRRSKGRFNCNFVFSLLSDKHCNFTPDFWNFLIFQNKLNIS